jgi:hypothetical protein
LSTDYREGGFGMVDDEEEGGGEEKGNDVCQCSKGRIDSAFGVLWCD